MPFMNTISYLLHKAVSEGYKECFKVTTRGLYSTSRSRFYRPEQVTNVESSSLPAGQNTNETLLYLIETSDGLKGTLIYDKSHPDTDLEHFMMQVEEIKRQMDNRDRGNYC